MTISNDGPGLSAWTSGGGCAAKWAAEGLRSIVGSLSEGVSNPELLIGLAPFDDGAVLRLTEELALVSTTDFFPPMVDDPSDFGAIAAANACSDIFAMGGRVRLAVNVAAFPEQLPIDTIQAILAAAASTVADAGGVVAGGHTIRSSEIIFGLAVQGTVHPGAIWTKAGGLPGDVLVLSKPLGAGIVLQAGSSSERAAATEWMRRLNRGAAEGLAEIEGGSGPHACTDVTGFGLAGHASEMVHGSSVSLRINTDALPLYDGLAALAGAGVRTGGDARNRVALRGHVTIGSEVSSTLDAVVHDPQTSGGLLAAVSPTASKELVDDGWWVIGEVVDGNGTVAFV